MKTVELNKLKQENNFEAFYKKISTFIPSLNKFAASKLKISENEDLIDKEFYDANGILNEVYMEVFKNFPDDIDEKQLRKMLFLSTIQKINEKATNEEMEEAFTSNFTVDDILKEELDLLNEEYSVEADGDYIFNKDLDDISYKQKSFKSTHFILDRPFEVQLTGKLSLNINPLSSYKKRNLFGWLYHSLPPKSKTITELYVFGDQNISEISDILLIDEEKVKRVIDKITKRFKSL